MAQQANARRNDVSSAGGAAVNARSIEGTPAAPPYHDKIVLKRTGKKTMRFAGDKITEATGYSRVRAHWYEIGVFSRVVGGYAVSIRHFNKSEDARDYFVADRFDALEDVMTFIETYRAANDLDIRFDPSSVHLSPADVTVLAAGLRARQAEYERAYQVVSGDVLHSIHALNHAQT